MINQEHLWQTLALFTFAAAVFYLVMLILGFGATDPADVTTL